MTWSVPPSPVRFSRQDLDLARATRTPVVDARVARQHAPRGHNEQPAEETEDGRADEPAPAAAQGQTQERETRRAAEVARDHRRDTERRSSGCRAGRPVDQLTPRSSRLRYSGNRINSSAPAPSSHSARALHLDHVYGLHVQAGVLARPPEELVERHEQGDHRMLAIEMGKRFFQPRFMSWLYLKRGSVQRIR